ncbi:50S ribosomal protein L18 [Candidatus Nomurabacteria bacterium RIFCSPLOWO2_02_FULL_42_17]|uniref:Large ribosomal subunit protein uL18 n=2 Tax=Candidatus Nomuraibacteriota TaxID=1752729 RepID=A0A1F6WH71_9BACT|nr:MAG: 50S ribosomal protein L18 [Parcubacteria group bacterium GW2011_GWA2_42_18]OGI81045.1 MAG: 50S ribosomal protein L18 [Candidatus Nomurabacteria bacterium RIFCSPHIGHO2_02_FULL_42_24]OGI97721.1 MAG: 50S ribosomal protein L18 [Candidatus Nomurabacteria bacterium RIFCSPLOWO2_02_FULL_42_17]
MKKIKNEKMQKRMRIRRKIRSRVFGTIQCPRFSVFRSNKYIYAQLINDEHGQTLVSASDIKIKKDHAYRQAGTKAVRAKQIGAMLAEAARAKGIEKVVFDRGGFRYTGRIKILADAARAGGLKF